jgi:hypothetical protein
MISITEFLILLLIVAGVWYWIDSMRAWEYARRTIRARCDEVGVQLLDDTVVLAKRRLLRNEDGRLTICREYRFEFTSDARVRYRGDIALSGGRILHLDMEPYRDPGF